MHQVRLGLQRLAGETKDRILAFSTCIRNGILVQLQVASTSQPPVCAMVSIISTPGRIG